MKRRVALPGDSIRLIGYGKPVARLQELGVQINDLYIPCVNVYPRYIRADDLIHLTEEGIALCAAQVEQAIHTAGDAAGPGAPI